MELTTALDFSHGIHRGVNGEHPDWDDFRSASASSPFDPDTPAACCRGGRGRRR